MITRNRLQKEFAPRIEKVIQSYYDAAAVKVESAGAHSAQGMIHGDTVLNGLTTTIKDLYHTAVLDATKRPVVNTGKEQKDLPSWLQLVWGYLDRFILTKVVLPISLTTIDDVNEVLKNGLDRGLGSAEMVKQLQDTELPKWRSRLIIRTEGVSATNTAQMIQAASSPWETDKQWIAVDDNRTRYTHGHNGVDGERIGLFEKFSNGLWFPGDKSAPAKEVCNCRCTLGYFAKRDFDGNLVPRAAHAETELAKLLS